MPRRLRAAVIAARGALEGPSQENRTLHDYAVTADPDPRPRLNLVIPTIDPAVAFGGVTTGIELFLRLAQATDAGARVMVDDHGAIADRSVVDGACRRVGLDPAAVEVMWRVADVPEVPVRARDVFVGYNWWTVLNLQSLVAAQAAVAGGRALPYLYICQDFEPAFYPYSSTHLVAWRGMNGFGDWWAIYNSGELARYVAAMGISSAETFVIEPTLSGSLRPLLPDGSERRRRRMLVYGRPGVARNCFPAVVAGLRRWAESYPGAAEWELVSAGAAHKPVALGNGVELRAVGKLSLQDYAAMLRESAVGLSLMASPHPSYPPLEMAHFGLLTVTNDYAFKSMAAAHDNLTALDDIRPASIAAALSTQCAAFERDPAIGTRGRSHRASYLSGEPYPFLGEMAEKLRARWAG